MTAAIARVLDVPGEPLKLTVLVPTLNSQKHEYHSWTISEGALATLLMEAAAAASRRVRSNADPA